MCGVVLRLERRGEERRDETMGGEKKRGEDRQQNKEYMRVLIRKESKRQRKDREKGMRREKKRGGKARKREQKRGLNRKES